MEKYILGEIFSFGGATLYKNPSDETVFFEFPYSFLDKETGSTFKRQKMCGPVERRLDFEYKVGCETQEHPFMRKICYCKTNLCNHQLN